MGRRLSIVNRVPLYIDVTSGFENDFYQRTYGLSAFRVSGDEIAGVRPSRLKRRATIATNLMLPFSHRWHFRESPGRFDRRYLSLRVARPIALDGYWQDERYFSDVRSQLKGDLIFRRGLTSASQQLAQEIRDSQAVAVHLRRLDVRSLPMDYYLSAFREIRERTRNPKFYLFSDNRSWPQLPAIPEDLIQVSSEGENAQFEDLWLMSQCRHFILANSTFSWWGAWLGRTPESIVVSPVMQEWDQIVKLPDEWRSIQWSKKS